MSKTTTMGDGLAERAEQIYESIHESVETEENIGKLISIDTVTGNYEIGTDLDLSGPRKLYAKNPSAQVFTMRIGFKSAYAIGGIVERRSS